MSILAIAASIAGGLEIVLRSIPTKGNYAPLGIIINVLHAVSNFFNVTKK